MQRRTFLLLAPLFPSAPFAPRLVHARARQMPPPNKLRDETLRLNELASNIHTLADARRLIDAIAELFADSLPPAWATASLRARLSEGEYLAVTDPQKRISEAHLAAAWNAYVTTIGTLADCQVSADDIHNLRDALFSTDRLMWNHGYRNFWALPSIFAVQPDGSLAPACRVIESLRILWDLDSFPENLSAARERVSKNAVASVLPGNAPQKQSSSIRGAYVTFRVSNNPVRTAERQYIREHGITAFNNSIKILINTISSV